MTADLTVISLGAGRQSTAMLLAACEGLIEPMPQFAIFSDTGWEYPEVYEHLNALRDFAAPSGIKVLRVSHGSLPDDVLNRHVFASIPGFTARKNVAKVPARWGPCPTCGGFKMQAEGDEPCLDCSGSGMVPVEWREAETGSKLGRIRRQCTARYKVEPMERKVRELLGAPVRVEPCRYCDGSGRRVAPWDRDAGAAQCSVCRGRGRRRLVGSVPEGATVETWIGFSYDETERMSSVGQRPYEHRRYPLIEDLRWNVDECIAWMAERGWKGVTKSACVGCPFHDDDTWVDMAINRPADFEEMVEFDRAYRRAHDMEAERFIHDSRRPLGEAVAALMAERAEAGDQGYLWPEFKRRRKVRHCNPFGCRAEEVDDEDSEDEFPGPSIALPREGDATAVG